MTMALETTWILKASVLDRSGALTSIASAFSNQGINLEATVAFGAQQDSPNRGHVAVAFQGTKTQRDFMIRRIQRLQKVTDVQWIRDVHADLTQALADIATWLESR